jgi:hypothetical protein
MVRALRTYLAGTETDFDIEFWQDTDLRGGHAWAESIEQAIALVEIFLLMLSPARRASLYIRDTESPLIRERATAIGGLIVPVVLKRTRWEPIAGNLQALPRHGRDVLAVADWTPPDHGFAAAEEQIASAIQDRLVRPPERLAWPSRLLHAQQTLAAPVWIVAGRQLALDPKDGRQVKISPPRS